MAKRNWRQKATNYAQPECYMRFININSMNTEIEQILKRKIRESVEYIESNDIRSSLEEYRTQILEETSKLTNERFRTMNLSFINEYYPESLKKIQANERIYNSTISDTLKYFKSLNKTEIIQEITKQVLESLQTFRLNSEYSEFGGLFFEFDSDPFFTGIAFPAQDFEIVINEPKYISFENGNYASDYPIEFNMQNYIGILFDSDFDKIAGEFENELNIFKKIKRMYINYIGLCLQESLKKPEVIMKLSKKGFKTQGVVYLNEHDCEVQTVYVNEN